MAERGNYWLRARDQRTSRRAVLRGGAAAGAGLAAIGLVGCGDDDDDDDDGLNESGTSQAGSPGAGTAVSTSTDEPKRGGELILGISPTGAQPMDPHTSLNKAFYYWAIFADKLVVAEHQTIEPIQGALVESWEQAEPLTLTLKARQGVTYHEGKVTNGRPHTAEDVAFSIERMAGKYDQDRAALFQRATLLRGLERAEAVDDETVQVTLSTPNAAFLNGLADFRNFPVARELVEQDPDFQNVAAFAGTGAFIIQSWDDSTSVGTYTANPNYWREGQPYLDSIRQVFLADPSASAAAFVSGQVPLVAVTTQTEPIVNQGRSDAERHSWEHSGWDYFRLNQTREPFTDLRVRRALHLAINRQELGDAGYGPGNWDLTGPLPSSFPGTWTPEETATRPGWNPDTKEEDIAEAKRLLEAAGFPDGEGISFGAVPSSSGKLHDDVIRIKDQLERAFPGMEINIQEPADPADFARRLGTGEYDAINYVSFPAPDSGLEAAQHYLTGGTRNYTDYSNADADALIEQTFSELEREARNQIIGELTNVLADDIFIISTNKNRPLYALAPELRGFVEFNSGPGTNGAYDVSFATRMMWLA